MPTQKQKQALEKLREEHQVDTVTWDPERDTPRIVRGALSKGGSQPPTSIVETFLEAHGGVFAITSPAEFEIVSIKEDSAGSRHVRVGRRHRRLRVYPSLLAFWIDADGVIRRIKAQWPRLRKLRTQKAVWSVSQALQVVSKARKGSDFMGIVGEPTLEYHLKSSKRNAEVVLAWNLVARFAGEAPLTEGFIVSAIDGSILLRYLDEDEVATTTTGIGANNADETALTPVRTLEVDDPGVSDLELLDATRIPQVETYDVAGAASYTGVDPLFTDGDADGVFDDVLTNSPRTASDRPAVDAHYNTGLIHDYFARSVTQNAIALFGRVGWADDAAQPWVSKVHYGIDYLTSVYSRSSRLTAHGDGDGINLTYKATLDTCGHEWAHALQASEVTGGVNPDGGFDGTTDENFVLKEAIADMFACAINRASGTRLGPVFEDDVAMAGATHASTGSRLRGMRRPADFGQPDHYEAAADTSSLGFAGTTSNYTRTGILDKAAYLMAGGGSHPDAASDPVTYPPIDVYGMGVRCFENILYYALVYLCGPADEFAEFRQDMIDAANILYPGTCKADTVEKAFDAVGIYQVPGVPPVEPPGPDPMITPWGARTDSSPKYQSPDIYVRDGAGNIAEPLKGQVNRLFALVTNTGDTDAIGVDVTFRYRPYGAGTSGNTWKTIATETADVPFGTSVEVETAWDLTDDTEDNGGTWPLPQGDFDHFCVEVELDHPSDVDTCNNVAQNNFTSVVDADGDSDGATTLLVGNSQREARWVAVVPDHRIDPKWRVAIDLTPALNDNRASLTRLLRDRRNGPPWLGTMPGATFLPLGPGESRAVRLSWQLGPADRYDGRVHGCCRGRASGGRGVAGEFRATVERLRLSGKRFSARLRGGLRADGATVRFRGDLEGTVERATGRFRGSFSGRGSRHGKERRVKFSAEGELAASANISLAVVAGDDEQGVDLGIRLVGDPRELCARPKLPRRKRTKRSRKGKKKAR